MTFDAFCFVRPAKRSRLEVKVERGLSGREFSLQNAAFPASEEQSRRLGADLHCQG